MKYSYNFFRKDHITKIPAIQAAMPPIQPISAITSFAAAVEDAEAALPLLVCSGRPVATPIRTLLDLLSENKADGT